MYIREEDIVDYAKRQGSEDDLAILIKRLIYASIRSGASVRFKTGKATRTGGWDGVVESDESTLNVEEGTSIWELSNQQPPLGSKFTSDYNRIKKNKSIKPIDTSLVFVTMQRWPGHENWAQKKRNGNSWKKLYTLTASELAGWINQCPAVLSWARHQFNLAPANFLSIDEYLHDVTHKDEKPIDVATFVQGRDKQRKTIEDWLNGAPSLLVLTAKTREEAISVFCAVVEQMDDQSKLSVKANTVIVESKTDLVFLKRKYKVALKRNLKLVIDFDNYDGSHSPVHQGHHLLLACLPGEVPQKVNQSNVLQVDVTRSGESASSESLPALVETKSLVPAAPKNLSSPQEFDFADPKLIQEDWMLDFTTLLLLGGWSRDDQNEVQLLLRLNPKIDLQEFEKRLVMLSKADNAPVVQRNRRWRFKSHQDIWPHLAQFISRSEIEEFQSIAKEVLGDFDRQFELPSEERWKAGFSGHVPRFSQKTKESVSESLICLKNYEPHISYFKSRSADTYSEQVLNGVLTPNWKNWASCAGYLPLMAEANPDAFLDLLNASLKAENGISNMFAEGSTGIFGGNPHTSLLWALEVLAWNKSYLNPVTKALLALSRFENQIPTNLINRPTNSLRAIYLSWLPQTSVDGDGRAQVLQSYAQRYPDEIFSLALSLIPRSHESASHNSKPKIRWQTQSVEQKLTWGQIFAYRDRLEELLVDFIKKDFKFLPDALEEITLFTENLRTTVLDKISFLIADDGVELTFKEGVWNKIRDIVSDQFSFNGSRLVLEFPELDELIMYYEELTPNDVVGRFGWLFGDRPNLLEGERDDWKAYNKKVQAEMESAIRQILKDDGETSLNLKRLVENVKHPQSVAQALYRVSPDYPVSRFEDWDVSNGRPKVFFEQFWTWKSESLTSVESLNGLQKEIASYTQEKQALVFLSLPRNDVSWKFIEERGEYFHNYYWRHIHFWSLQNWDSQAQFILDQFLKFRRFADAIALVSSVVESIVSKEPVVLEVTEAFSKNITAEDLKNFWRQHIDYDLGKIFSYLEANFLDQRERVAQLEFQLLPLLENSGRGLQALFSTISESPDTFAQLIKNAFRSRNQDNKALDENERALANVSYKLLDKWREIPGQSNGSIDEEKLRSWLTEVRKLLADSDRSEIGENQIGAMLAQSPTGSDGLWPHEVIRSIIEESYNEDLHSGFQIEVFNSRGVVSKSIGEGGKKERELAQRFRKSSEGIALTSPQTSRILKSLADRYDEDAKREDLRAEDFVD